jgi:hypothetical protein
MSMQGASARARLKICLIPSNQVSLHQERYCHDIHVMSTKSVYAATARTISLALSPFNSHSSSIQAVYHPSILLADSIDHYRSSSLVSIDNHDTAR